MRVKAANVDVTKAVIKAVFGDVEYLSRKNMSADELAFVTSVMSEKAAAEACTKIADGAEILGRIRVLDY